MAKVIKIDAGDVTIVQDNGEIIEVEEYTLSFNPKLNDMVEVYKTDSGYIVNKATPTKTVQQYTEKIYTGKKQVNKIAYSLLAIFLGSIGVHKFYAGKIGLGIVYVLLSWTGITTIIGFIEGIIGLTKEEVSPGMILV